MLANRSCPLSITCCLYVERSWGVYTFPCVHLVKGSLDCVARHGCHSDEQIANSPDHPALSMVWHASFRCEVISLVRFYFLGQAWAEANGELATSCLRADCGREMDSVYTAMISIGRMRLMSKQVHSRKAQAHTYVHMFVGPFVSEDCSHPACLLDSCCMLVTEHRSLHGSGCYIE